ncbi:FecR family protein [Horticoccus sp. 23ND18S-11]|uniref:FecR family protein n=1 Tax=Horticoccus sp. 23ND18S-11 TaxID=3391832 RepID=UPI0039C93643
MKRPEPDSPAGDRRSQAAADWLVRRDRGLTAAEQDEFLQWLAADPRHGEWFALHRGVTGDFAALAHWRPEHSAEPNPDLLARPRRVVHWLAPVALAAAAAIAVAWGWWRASPSSAASSLVADREPARRLLADGSAVELNRGAVVSVAFTAQERRATLVSGEAHFTIATNPARPFIVRAGGVDVRAVGTAFSVRLEAGAVEVLVTEGRVGVQREVERAVADASAGTVAATVGSLVDAGQRATVSLTNAEPPLIAPATSAQISRHLTWHPQLLDFSSAPLAVAVAEFNLRNQVQFELADADLAAIPIVASIRSDNVEGFAQFLAAAPGVQIERRGPNTIVVRRKR